METNERTIVIEAITECTKGDGWANLAEVGVYLRKNGIKYGKLSRYLLNFNELTETRIDQIRQPPVAYIRLKEP